MKRFARQIRLVLVLGILSTLLGGCLYPNERRGENQIPHETYVEMTQTAIEKFQADTGILPIVTRDVNTPFFEKYEIDFNKLTPKYLPDAPANAFEKGGLFKYVLIDVETKPLVKLIDLGTVSTVREVQQAVSNYIEFHQELPIDKDLGNGYYTIKLDKISLASRHKQVESFYTHQLNSYIMNAKGEVGIDYASDLATLIRENKLEIPKDTDPRYVVARNSFFVPIKSFPYKMENGEPVLMKL
ncbi:hypothetical protein [Brevibacillus dissolubilis]|uniref:hypothetical protein n=1 Tax=Brevibacillus dissolubilis TaxID=1844116 RepID=UPI001116C926|nr:hypothetical protein [Brevibacillus dissolubilis]